MENFKDVSRYNRRKEIEEQKKMKTKIMGSNNSNNMKDEEDSEDSVLEREFDILDQQEKIIKPTEDLAKRKKFIENEIMETEIGYVRNLVHLFEYFLLPIRKTGILSRENYQTIFRNINIILAINSTLLGEFHKAIYNNSGETLSSIFSTSTPALKLYVGYVNSYPNAIKCLNEILSKDSTFDAWEKTQRNTEVNGVKLFPLRNYLSLPLQRITRYHILFSDLLGALDGEEFYYLSQILDEIKTLSEYCMEKKAESDNLEAL